MNDEIFSTIAPTDLRDFLKSKGWSLIDEAFKDGLYVLNHKNHHRRQLVFPIDDSVVDYIDSVETVINKLIDMEKTSFQRVINDFSQMKDDTICFRIVDKYNENAFISLNYALNAIKGVKDMLLSAACSTVLPQLNHPKMNRSEAKQLVENSRFRQTEMGSFVIKVSTPVKALDFQANIFETDVPFVRQSTLLINHSVAQLVTAIQTDRMEQLISDIKQQPKPLLSTNICKALLNFQEENNHTDLYLNFQWAGIIAKPLNVNNSIKIQKDYYSRIDDIRQELKTHESEKEDTFVGTVETLTGDFDNSEQRAGYVMLDLYQQDMESIRVKANLIAKWHRQAIEAYQNSGLFIQITGRLLSGNQPREIVNITSFEIINRN